MIWVRALQIAGLRKPPRDRPRSKQARAPQQKGGRRGEPVERMLHIWADVNPRYFPSLRTLREFARKIPTTTGKPLFIAEHPGSVWGDFTLRQLVADVAGNQAQTALTVRVLPVNDRPLAGADSARVSRRSRSVRIAVTASDRDADGDPLRVVVSRRPKRGTVSVSGRRIVYRPKKRWPGRDSFAYRLTDPSGATATATVRVTGPRRR